jgi:UDPglucose--hexose-1-phosphate uridylyltransferase
MMNFNRPHRRFNPLTGQWILVSPHRTQRPWQGQVEKAARPDLPQYDPSCYLCPGNTRSNGDVNPNYTNTFVFRNDFAALLAPDPDEHDLCVDQGLFKANAEVGECRVICFSPRHDLTLPVMAQPDVETVVKTWTDQYVELGAKDWINYVQIFENKGAAMGASNPHPHSQVWATSCIPNDPATETIRQAEYLHEHGSCLLCDYLEAERKDGSRIVAANDTFTALVPFWATWPFETLVIANRHLGSMPELNPQEVSGLADILRQVTIRYDNLFEVSFPYSMGFHQIPTDGKSYPEWHFHFHYYPPLLRSATVRKFMVGFELLGMPQRDITPETAAERLRALPDVHFTLR